MRFPTLRALTAAWVAALVMNAACGAAETNQVSPAEKEFNDANPKMLWGALTNFPASESVSSGQPVPQLSLTLRAGVNAKGGVAILPDKAKKLLPPNADIHIFTRSPNVWAGVPPFNESVILSMVDSNGVSVPRTTEGLALGKPLALPPKTTKFWWSGNNRHEWFRVLSTAPVQILAIGRDTPEVKKLRPDPPEHSARWMGMAIDPRRYFSIKKPGLYELSLTLRLYVIDTNTYLKPITLPTVSIPVFVEEKP